MGEISVMWAGARRRRRAPAAVGRGLRLRCGSPRRARAEPPALVSTGRVAPSTSRAVDAFVRATMSLRSIAPITASTAASCSCTASATRDCTPRIPAIDSRTRRCRPAGARACRPRRRRRSSCASPRSRPRASSRPSARRARDAVDELARARDRFRRSEPIASIAWSADMMSPFRQRAAPPVASATVLSLRSRTSAMRPPISRVERAEILGELAGLVAGHGATAAALAGTRGFDRGRRARASSSGRRSRRSSR